MDNRQKILDCSLNLFADKGYDAVGVQEIVDAAGITKPTLYHYFGSKYGLLEAILSEYFSQLTRIVAETAEYQGDLPSTLEKVVKAMFRFALANPTFYRLQLALYFSPRHSQENAAVSRWNKTIFQIIESLFLAAVKNHGNMKGRHSAYAATFIGMVNTYIGMALNENIDLGNELVYRAVHQFQHGIYS